MSDAAVALGRRRVALTVGGGPRLGPPLLLSGAGVVVALIALLPLFFVAGYTVDVGPAEAYRLVVRPRVAQLLGNTVSLLALTLPLCALLALAAAWLHERAHLPGRRVWGVLLAAPLAVPAFVNGFAWVSLTARVEGYAGAVLIITLSYFPLVYLPVAAALRGLDPALEESARALGYGPWRTFLRVVVPQLRPALVGGMLLVGLHILAEFGALQMLRFQTFTTAIYDQYQSTFNGPAANMLAAVLVVGCLALLAGDLWLGGRARYARLGMGAARPIARVGLGPLATLLALAFLGALVVLALGVPLASLLFWLATGTSARVNWGEVVATMATSLSLGLGGAVLATLAALPVTWLSVRHRNAFTTAVERSTYIGHALPGIVVALALVTITVRVSRPLYQTTALLLVAYGILFLPLATVSMRAALLQAPPVLDDAARSLGAGPLAVLRRVTFPLMRPGVGAGAALVFLAILTELTATLLLAPTGTETLATRFWTNADSIEYGAAAPYALVMVLLSAPSTYLLTRDIRAGASR